MTTGRTKRVVFSHNVVSRVYVYEEKALTIHQRLGIIGPLPLRGVKSRVSRESNLNT
jgi:hypothetical protein